MACHHPLRAYKTRSGVVTLGREPPDTERIDIPCGGCIGCREAKAKEWALRCTLEYQNHDETAFATLTYNEQSVPPTLTKRDLQLFHKRIRRRKAARTVRHFSCGEYGENNGRPHYHSLLFGMGENEKEIIQEAWPHGYAYTVKASQGAINYVAGYTAKKYGDEQRGREERVPEGYGRERVDKETGEVYWTWQPPFLQMSLKPGIGGDARKHTNSWRAYAVLNGQKQAVPRYLHEAWKKQATEEEIEQLANEKNEQMKTRKLTQQQREAAEQEGLAKRKIKAARRKY